MEEKKTGSPREERRFAIFQASSISMIAEAEGHLELPSDVNTLLAEDVTYRLREVVQNACQYMKHSRRKLLTVEDVNKALKSSDVQPVYGHGAPEGQPWRQTKEGELYLVEDLDMALSSIACNSQVPHATGSTTVRANWLVLEGNQKSSSFSLSTQGKLNGKNGRNISEDLLQYYNNVTRAILGTDQELMKLAITDLRTNPNLSPLLPYLVEFISNWIKNMSPDTLRLIKLLYTIHAIVNNNHMFLEPRPYLSVLTECILHCLIEPVESVTGQHWIMRDYAARLMAIICRLWNSSVNRLYDQILNQLSEILHDSTRPFSAHYGVITALSNLGVQALKDILIPYFPTYYEHLMSTMNDNTLVKERHDACTVHGALTHAAALVIKYHKWEPLQVQQLSSCETIPVNTKLQLNPTESVATESPNITLNLPELASKSLDIKKCYPQFMEYFGDSLLASLPIHVVNTFKRPFNKQPVISLADADSYRTGEEMLKEFLKFPQSIFKRTVSMDVDAERKSDSRHSCDIMSSDMSYSGDTKSERSSRSERSQSDDCFLGEDADLTVKTTVSETSKGIKLFISKRPKKIVKGKPESKRKRGESARSRLHDAFDIEKLRITNKEIHFGFNTKDWQSGQKFQTYKPQSKPKVSTMVPPLKNPKSEYRKLCEKMTAFGRRTIKKRSEIKTNIFTHLSVTNISCFL